MFGKLLARTVVSIADAVVNGKSLSDVAERAVSNFGVGGAQDIGAVVRAHTEQIKDAVSDVVDSALETGGEIVENVTSSDTVDKAKDFVSDAVDSALETGEEIVKAVTSVAEEIDIDAEEVLDTLSEIIS